MLKLYMKQRENIKEGGMKKYRTEVYRDGEWAIVNDSITRDFDGSIEYFEKMEKVYGEANARLHSFNSDNNKIIDRYVFCHACDEYVISSEATYLKVGVWACSDCMDEG